MSDFLLRQAAAKMRADAETEAILRDGDPYYDDEASCYERAWLPAVALVVADWLDTAGADLWAHGLPECCSDGCDVCDDDPFAPHIRAALRVSLAYLGCDQ